MSSAGTSLAIRKPMQVGLPIVNQLFGITATTKLEQGSLVDGAIGFFLPKELDLETIITSKLGAEILHPGLSHYTKYDWAKEVSSRYHQVLLPVPNSHGKTAEEQEAYIRSLMKGSWRPAGLLPALVAYILFVKQTGKDPLRVDAGVDTNWCRTGDLLGNGKHAVLTMVGNRIDITESAPDKAGSALLMAASQ